MKEKYEITGATLELVLRALDGNTSRMSGEDEVNNDDVIEARDKLSAEMDGQKTTSAAGESRSTSALPAEFLVFWNKLVLRFKANRRRAYRALIRCWASGEDVPGYGTLREFTCRQSESWRAKHFPLPRGWSYENLVRKTL